ncbi:MAG: hypothetical protein ACK55Z_15290, partial [bacterium]
MSSWSSPSSWMRSQAGSLCRKKKTKKQLASSSSGHNSIISARSCEGRRLPSGPTASSLSIRWSLVRVCCCRRSSFNTEYGSSSSGWATAWKHSWMISLLRAATVWSNLSHSSITPLALKRDSTWANHPAALSVQ